MLLNRGRREFRLKVFQKSGHMTDAALLAPYGEATRGIHISFSRMVVIYLRREEFQNA